MLNKHRGAAEFGGDVGVEHAEVAWKRLSADLGFEAKLERASYPLHDHVAYWSWKLSHVWMQPFSVAMSAFVLIFGSWIATVNASFDAVPGDILYPVKLATEHVQISLATSGEQRAKLHTEFAGRRLDEINTITTSGVSTPDDSRMQAAVDGFKQEIASVNTELAAISQNDPGQAAALAIIVDQKTDAYAAAFEQTSGQTASAGSQTQIDEAITAVKQTNEQALDAIVDSHEANQQPQTEESLQNNFEDKLRDLQTRSALSLGRLDVVKAALVARNGMTMENEKLIRQIKDDIGAYNVEMSEAMDVFAAGGYRSAFDRLATIDSEITQLEELITELEIEITTGL